MRLVLPEGEQIQHKMLNPMRLSVHRRRLRATTTESVKICWNMTRLITSSERSFTQSAARCSTAMTCVIRSISMIDELVEKYVNMVIGDDQRTCRVEFEGVE